ncbi:MAG TPA: tryptophan--tRNA ligase [Spirochaetota bacterium]|nr:tryptophan--tRNA ligase [Spirochaetota bacterium]
MKKIALTGIKPTGIPHLGNLLGAIKPALKLSEKYDARYFIADYHALNSIKDPEILTEYTMEVAAAWLACGLDPEKVLFYRQSDIPEVFELSTMLMCFAAKGRMNGAHAYKAAVAANLEKKKDADKGINMGLFTYPVLMAADILLFDADKVPVGPDQLQHLEITAEIARAVNFNYKKELLKIPAPLTTDKTLNVYGTDGRKMSKSYNNTIPLFAPAKKLRKKIMRIVTNSQSVEAPKDPENCNIFALYRLFAAPEEQEELAARYRKGGMGWGYAKEELFRVLDRELSPYRERYCKLMQDKKQITAALEQGAVRAGKIAARKLDYLRRAAGFAK